jgi:hypothetical protein
MNELTPEGAAVISNPTYKDRSAGLVVFGILTILLGGLCSLFIPLMLAGQHLAAQGKGAAPMPMATLVPGLMVYGFLAVALVWLGIGSIMARRWARALLLIFSWNWLVVGIVSMISMAVIVPKVIKASAQTVETAGHPAGPAAPMMAAIMTGMMILFGVVFVLLPGAWIFFYRSRHVKATCETRDPVARWTDACPLPILALCIWAAFSLVMVAIMPFTTHFVFPLFGVFLSGAPAAGLAAGIAILWGYAGWSLYKLEKRGWWVMFVGACVFGASAVVTFGGRNMIEMYRQMGYPQAQMEQMEKTGMFTGNFMPVMMGCNVAAFLGYLLFIRKFLRRAA